MNLTKNITYHIHCIGITSNKEIKLCIFLLLISSEEFTLDQHRHFLYYKDQTTVGKFVGFVGRTS